MAAGLARAREKARFRNERPHSPEQQKPAPLLSTGKTRAGCHL